jgi:methylase of polypeptide subunit release factors
MTSVLDIGCGTGIFAFLFAEQYNFDHIYSIDINQEAVKCAFLNAELLSISNYTSM